MSRRAPHSVVPSEPASSGNPVSGGEHAVQELTLGWLPLLAGAFLLALALLTPAWLQNRQLAAEVRTLERQAAHFETLAGDYRHVSEAIDQQDPLLMQRIAWHYFALKPAGRRVLFVDEQAPWPTRNAEPVEQWLHRPPPTPEPVEMPGARWARLATGANRLPLALAAGCLLLGGWIRVRPGRA